MFAAKPMTVEVFDVFAAQSDKLYEYIAGEVVEVPSNAFSSKISITIAGFLFIFLRANPIGHLTGENGGYQVAGERYAPDVAFISFEKQPELAKHGYNPNPPDLAVEVVSPGNLERHLRVKVFNYLAVGTVVWLVDPELRQIEVYVPGEAVRVLGMDDTLDGGDVLPGFSLAVKEIFS